MPYYTIERQFILREKGKQKQKQFKRFPILTFFLQVNFREKDILGPTTIET